MNLLNRSRNLAGLVWALIGFGALCWACSASAAALAAPQDRSFTANTDGTVQRYVLALPMDFDPGTAHPLMIALHGHGADRWQFGKSDRGECRAAREVAAQYGAVFVSPDYRASTSWMGPRAEEDLVQLIRLLKREYKIRKTILVGASMGGTSVLIFTALHPNMVDGVVSLNGTANMVEYKNFQDYIARSYGGTKEEVPAEYRKRSAEFYPKRFTMPIGLTVSGKDTVVPPQSVRRFVTRVREHNAQVLLIDREEAGHETGYEDTRKVLDFVFGQAKASVQRG